MWSFSSYSKDKIKEIKNKKVKKKKIRKKNKNKVEIKLQIISFIGVGRES